MASAKVVSIETKIDMFIGEMRQQIQLLSTEIHNRDNQRAAEIREIRAELKDMGKHVRNLTIAAIVGMGTMTIAGIAIAVSIVMK